MSQQQDGSNSEVAGLAQAVRNTQRRRSSRQQQTAEPGSSRRSSRLAANSSDTGQQLQVPQAAAGAPSSKPQPQAAGPSSSRWADAKEVKIVNNPHTEKADKRCMKAFAEFLQQQHGITDDPATIEHSEIKKLVADFTTRVRASSTGLARLCVRHAACIMLPSCSATPQHRPCEAPHMWHAACIMTLSCSAWPQHRPCKALHAARCLHHASVLQRLAPAHHLQASKPGHACHACMSHPAG